MSSVEERRRTGTVTRGAPASDARPSARRRAPSPRPKRTALPAIPVGVWCGLIALAVAAIAVGAVLVDHDWKLSVLVHMSPSEPMADVARADPSFGFVDPAAHYDGVYFFTMALDPLTLGREHALIDLPANRYGHPAYGWAAGLLALFQVQWLPFTLAFISLLSLYVAALLAADLAVALGLTPWLGLAVALDPGLIYAVTADTSEAFGTALLLATLVAWLGGRRWLAGLLLVPLCFAKEPLLALPVGLGLWELLRLRRDWSLRRVRRTLLPLVPGPALYAAWYLVVHARLGVFPYEQGLDRLSLPFTGWADTLSRASQLSTANFGEMQVGQATVPILAALLVAIVLGAVVALRARSPVDLVYLPSAALMACLGWLPLLYPKDLIRISSFVLLLLPFVLAMAVRAKDADGADDDRRADGGRHAEGGRHADASPGDVVRPADRDPASTAVTGGA